MKGTIMRDEEAYDLGEKAWMLFIDTAEWCQANPLPGREEVERS